MHEKTKQMGENQENMKLRDTKSVGTGGAGGREQWMDMIKIHYIHVWKFQRIKRIIKEPGNY